MFDPLEGDREYEFIELYNSGDQAQSLFGWTIGDSETQETLIPAPESSATLLEPASYCLVVDQDYWESERIYDGRIPAGTLVMTISDGSFGSNGLGNETGETVELRDSRGNVIDARLYSADAIEGFSEERVFFDEVQWSFSFRAGGTPGGRNSVTPYEYDVALLSRTLMSLSETTDSFERSARFRYILDNVGIQEISGGIVQSRMMLLIDESLLYDFSSERWQAVPGAKIEALSSVKSLPGGYYRVEHRVLEDDNPSNDQFVDTVIVAHAFGHLMIHEIMANPRGYKVPDCEWVELLNVSDTYSVCLKDWAIVDAGGSRGQIVSDELLEIEPGERWLLAQNDAILSLSCLDASRVFVPETWPSLNNDGDALALLDPQGTLVDTVTFGESVPGHSFARDGVTPTPLESVWWVTPDPVGATPQGENRTPGLARELAISWNRVRLRERDHTSDLELEVAVHHQGNCVVETVDLYWEIDGVEVKDQIPLIEPGDRRFLEYTLENPVPGNHTIRAELKHVDANLTNNSVDTTFAVPSAFHELWFSELMSHPDDLQGGEWIEISRSGELTTLDGWCVRDGNGRTGTVIEGEVNGGFRDQPFALVAREPDRMRSAWDIPEEIVIHSMDPWVALNNDGGELVLLDPAGNVIDSVHFPASAEAVSLARVALGIDPGKGDWRQSEGERGATPGAEEPESSEQQDWLVIEPDPFSPDGDGFEDVLTLELALEAPSVHVEMTLFTRFGEKLGNILDCDCSGMSTLEWDGRRGLRETLPRGVYVYLIRVSEARGSGEWERKGTLVSAGR